MTMTALFGARIATPTGDDQQLPPYDPPWRSVGLSPHREPATPRGFLRRPGRRHRKPLPLTRFWNSANQSAAHSQDVACFPMRRGPEGGGSRKLIADISDRGAAHRAYQGGTTSRGKKEGRREKGEEDGYAPVACEPSR